MEIDSKHPKGYLYIMDVILGGVLSVLATFVFNLLMTKRQESKRWDSKRLEALLEARNETYRAAGRIEAMVVGEIDVPVSNKRPVEIETALDKAWYALESVRVLFPIASNTVDELQSLLIKRLEAGYQALQLENGAHAYFLQQGLSEALQNAQLRLLTDCRIKLAIH